ncbi:MAG TPA: rhodanese-like domain-containing protein [Anaerolineales bacterium]|nr:rhodanese-like domain-containing protein [Anaerolineales bacterium]
MGNVYGAPEITVHDLARKLSDDEDFILLDVREHHEIGTVSIEPDQLVVIPLSELARKQLMALNQDAFPKNTEIIVMCHHGVRSAQVTAWMRQNGWNDVWSLAGGIDAYAHEIDPRIGFY